MVTRGKWICITAGCLFVAGGMRFVAWGGAALSPVPVPPVPATAPAATAPGAAAVSTPAEKQGLSLTIEPTASRFASNEPIGLRVTLKNVSSDTFRLPDRVDPAPYNFWHLKLVGTESGKDYTGATSLPGGAAPEPGEITPVSLAPGKAVTTKVLFRSYAYVEGAFDLTGAKNTIFQLERAASPNGFAGRRGRGSAAQFFLPAGTYKVRLNVGFRSYPEGPSVPERVAAAKAAIDKDPMPLWKGGEILSNPVEITITGGGAVPPQGGR